MEHGDSEHSLIGLLDLIEKRIIPELSHACSTKHRRKIDPRALTFEARQIDDAVSQLLAMLVGRQQDEAIAFSNALIADGMSLKVLYIDVLSIVARRLGEMWESDELDFSAVTMALGILQTVLSGVREPLTVPEETNPNAPRIVLSCACEDQHTFGLLTLARFFEEAGWEVVGGTETECGPELAPIVSETRLPLAGISVGSEVHLLSVTKTIPHIRRASMNPDIKILIGGPIFADGTLTADACGADFCCINAELAVETARTLID